MSSRMIDIYDVLFLKILRYFGIKTRTFKKSSLPAVFLEEYQQIFYAILQNHFLSFGNFSTLRLHHIFYFLITSLEILQVLINITKLVAKSGIYLMKNLGVKQSGFIRSSWIISCSWSVNIKTQSDEISVAMQTKLIIYLH